MSLSGRADEHATRGGVMTDSTFTRGSRSLPQSSRTIRVQTLRGQRSRRSGSGFRPTLIECKPEDVDG